MAHRSFELPASAGAEVTFDLAGETFHCVSALPAGLVTDFLSAATDDNVGVQAGALLDILKAAVVDADLPRFERLVRSKDKPIPLETLGQLVEWLVGELSGYPTVPPSSSADGRPNIGAAQMARLS